MTRPPLRLVWDGTAEDDETPFEALLRSSEEDPAAASGLAIAYSDMPRDVRERLLAAIVEDAEARGRPPAALALLLGVEEELDLAVHMMTALRQADWTPIEKLDAGLVWGDAEEGGACVVRHVYGELIDALRLRWSSGAIEADALPLSRATDLEDLKRRIGVPNDARTVPFEHAVDTLSEGLWRACREDTPIPEAVRAFADVFTPARRP